MFHTLWSCYGLRHASCVQVCRRNAAQPIPASVKGTLAVRWFGRGQGVAGGEKAVHFQGKVYWLDGYYSGDDTNIAVDYDDDYTHQTKRRMRQLGDKPSDKVRCVALLTGS